MGIGQGGTVLCAAATRSGDKFELLILTVIPFEYDLISFKKARAYQKMMEYEPVCVMEKLFRAVYCELFSTAVKYY